jgi:hypothetical protein
MYISNDKAGMVDVSIEYIINNIGALYGTEVDDKRYLDGKTVHRHET